MQRQYIMTTNLLALLHHKKNINLPNKSFPNMVASVFRYATQLFDGLGWYVVYFFKKMNLSDIHYPK